MTPIRVRGKRSAAQGEKWHYEKRRKATLVSKSSNETGTSGSQASDAILRRSSKRKKRASSLSRLERLPTEILDVIFMFSTNVELALASPILVAQLKGSHLQHELTSRVISPILCAEDLSKSELVQVSRLMNSRFFTYKFLCAWVDGLLQTPRSVSTDSVLHRLISRCDLEDIVDDLPAPTCSPSRILSTLHLPQQLLAPEKLLRGPFAEADTQLLTLFTYRRPETLSLLIPAYRATAIAGQRQAITEGAVAPLRYFQCIGLLVDTKLLQFAVLEAGCDEKTVEALLAQNFMDSDSSSGIDFLDSTLWAWAEDSRKSGNGKGQWLIATLQTAARQFDSARGIQG